MDADALFPQPQVAEDALDHVTLVDEGDNAHFARADRAEKRIGFPHLLDEFAPLGRGDSAGPLLGDVNDLCGLLRGFGLFGGPLTALAAHLVAVPPVVAEELEPLVRDVLGDSGDKIEESLEGEVTLERECLLHQPVCCTTLVRAAFFILSGK